MKKFFLLLITASLFSSCADELSGPGNVAGIFGTWVFSDYADESAVYKRAYKFEDGKAGFRIEPDGKFIEHKINGWCGTPPVVYSDYDGKWLPESEKILLISVGYWGGIETKRMRIESVSDNQLEVNFLYEL